MRTSNKREKELFIQYGSAAAEAMMDYPCFFFQPSHCTGFIAYRIEFKCAIIFGDPICPHNELVELAQAFRKYCEKLNLNVIYITVSEKFTKLIQQHYSILMEVCEEIIINPQDNPIYKSHRLEHRVNKAVSHGLTFHEYVPFDQEIEVSIRDVGIQWQKGLKGHSLYIGHLNFFENPIGKRWFYVKDGERITSMAMLSRLEAQEGWLLKFLMTMPVAFHETSEFLMFSLLSKLQKENCHFLTKGMMPLDSLNNVTGLNFSSPLVKGVFNIMSVIFKFKKRKEYWQRYHPEKIPSYLLLSHPKLGINEIRALFKVFRMN